MNPLEVWAERAKAAASRTPTPAASSFPFKTMAVGDQFTFPPNQRESVAALAEVYGKKLGRVFRVRAGWVCRREA